LSRQYGQGLRRVDPGPPFFSRLRVRRFALLGHEPGQFSGGPTAASAASASPARRSNASAMSSYERRRAAWSWVIVTTMTSSAAVFLGHLLEPRADGVGRADDAAPRRPCGLRRSICSERTKRMALAIGGTGMSSPRRSSAIIIAPLEAILLCLVVGVGAHHPDADGDPGRSARSQRAR
jgi:hypothetical protein